MRREQIQGLKQPKNTAELAKRGIEPDDMVGPVGFEPINCGTNRDSEELEGIRPPFTS